MELNKNTTIGIIGYGIFGKLIASLFAERGIKVLVFSRNEEEEVVNIKFVSLREAVQADVVIPSVPISVFEGVIKEISPYLKPNSILVDVCSVKKYPAQVMEKYIPANVHFLATHPMWGVDSVRINKGIKDLKVVLCPSHIPDEIFEKIKNILNSVGFRVVIMSAEEHDKQVANSQVIAQFVGKILELMPVREVDISTKGYEHLLNLLPFVINNTEELFCDLQNYNVYGEKVREKFLETAGDVQEKIMMRKNKEDFAFNREMINLMDKEIIRLLEKRFSYSDSIGKIKKEKGIQIEDRKREAEIIKNRSKSSRLDKNFIENLYKAIFKESKRRQTKTS